MKFKKFDAHTHIYPEAIAEKACINLGKFYDFTVHGAGTYPALCTELKENGFNGMFLLCVATNAHQVQKVNDTIAGAVTHAREQGFETYGFMGMHQDYEDMAGEVERCRNLGLIGAKIHPDIQGCDIDDKRFYPMYEAL
ncbi:MAG: amidohydrolase, partial [Clostridia bacterium]|nr:amidohydrolase [Clostridia bacterium]